MYHAQINNKKAIHNIFCKTVFKLRMQSKPLKTEMTKFISLFYRRIFQQLWLKRPFRYVILPNYYPSKRSDRTKWLVSDVDHAPTWSQTDPLYTDVLMHEMLTSLIRTNSTFLITTQSKNRNHKRQAFPTLKQSKTKIQELYFSNQKKHLTFLCI